MKYYVSTYVTTFIFMDFYTKVGKVALGSRLRRLSEMLTEDAAEVYKLYGVPTDPRWFPVLHVLSGQESATITEIAQAIGHSHPSVSQIVKKMKAREPELAWLVSLIVGKTLSPPLNSSALM